MQIHGSAFMEPLDDPIQGIASALEEAPLRQVADAVIVEIHAEATAEKMTLAHYVDGRATLVIGAHTHIPTADAQVLPGGTAYMTDAGMCGDYDSVIGMKKAPDRPAGCDAAADRAQVAGRRPGDAVRRLCRIGRQDRSCKADRADPRWRAAARGHALRCKVRLSR